MLLDTLEATVTCARDFNASVALRAALWRRGFMRFEERPERTPHLLEQECDGARHLLATLFRMCHAGSSGGGGGAAGGNVNTGDKDDDAGRSGSLRWMRDVAEPRLVRLCARLLRTYLEARPRDLLSLSRAASARPTVGMMPSAAARGDGSSGTSSARVRTRRKGGTRRKEKERRSPRSQTKARVSRAFEPTTN